MIALLLAPLACLVQRGAPPPAQRNPILDGVAVQAGDALVTFSELERTIKRAGEAQPPADREEEERQRAEILIFLVTQRLEEQAGAELGLDAEQIERISRAGLVAEREQAGLDAYLAELRAQGKDALAGETDRQREIRRYLWEQSAIGRAVATKRATRDHGVRPGELRAIYAEHKERLAQGTVQLRLLIVASDAVGGPEAARASCEEARQLVAEGEDMALLVDERGAAYRDTSGLLPFSPARGLRDPALAAWAEEAEIGDLSEVAPFINPQTGKPAPELGYQVAELHDRRIPEVPEFDSGVQLMLRQQFTEQRRNRILERERERLRREGYYYWLSPVLTGPKTPAEPAR